MERNRHLDLLRVVAIGGVVYGHWLLVDVTYSGGLHRQADDRPLTSTSSSARIQ